MSSNHFHFAAFSIGEQQLRDKYGMVCDYINSKCKQDQIRKQGDVSLK